jgi:serine/threonine-protein kinase RsbW
MQKQQNIIAKTSIHCSLNELKLVRTFIGNQLQQIHVCDNDIDMIVLSVDEICANLIKHALNLKPDETIEITLIHENGGIRVNILDHGISFNPVNYYEKSIQKLIHEKKKGGLGLMLVNKIMDKIEYQIEESYNVCSMYKRVTLC